MFDKMKQLMDFKNQAERINKELDGEVIEVTEVKGIKIEISGSQDFKKIEIDESIINKEDKNGLERDLLKALNAAIKKSQSVAASKMSSVMPGLPGL